MFLKACSNMIKSVRCQKSEAEILYTTTNIVAFYSLSPSDGERAGERGTLPRLLTLCIASTGSVHRRFWSLDFRTSLDVGCWNFPQNWHAFGSSFPVSNRVWPA